MNVLAGIDIGGTKCAVCLGVTGGAESEGIRLIDRVAFPTNGEPDAILSRLAEELERLLAKHGFSSPDAVGVSCGGPLDSRRGLALSPPNLPGWLSSSRLVQPHRPSFQRQPSQSETPPSHLLPPPRLTRALPSVKG